MTRIVKFRLLLVLTVLTWGFSGYVATAFPLSQYEHAHHACQEDEKCWNCETMGNHVCGRVEVNLYRRTPNGPLFVEIYDEHNHQVFIAAVESVNDER